MKIGLTGSIACGKSTVSQYLRQKGCFIVDADAISRALTADGGAALPEIRRAFGDDVFSGVSLDRAKLGQLVFADAQKRETLNAILHPMILSEIRRQLDRLDAPGQIVVGDVPLLFECGMESMFDTVWVVRAARETQIQRLFERDGLSREQAERRVRAGGGHHQNRPETGGVAVFPRMSDPAAHQAFRLRGRQVKDRIGFSAEAGRIHPDPPPAKQPQQRRTFHVHRRRILRRDPQHPAEDHPLGEGEAVQAPARIFPQMISAPPPFEHRIEQQQRCDAAVSDRGQDQTGGRGVGIL